MTPRPKPHTHRWKEIEFRVVGLEAIDRCVESDCHVRGQRRRVDLMRCPLCERRPMAQGYDANCHICHGRGALRPPHACRCCGSPMLAAAKILCQPCDMKHGYEGGWCDRESISEKREALKAGEVVLAPRKVGRTAAAESIKREMMELDT